MPAEAGSICAPVHEGLTRSLYIHTPKGSLQAPALPYAELHCLSNFSFQRGASSARELFERARAVGYGALAITDECSLAGVVRAFEASRETGVPLIVGSEFRLDNGLRCVLLVRDQAGYSLLCALITQSRRRASKGRYQACRADWELLLQPALQAEQLAGQLYALWLPGASAEADLDELRWLQQYFGDSLRIAVELHRGPEDRRLCARLQALGEQLQITLVACGDVRMHVRGRRALLDVLTATALKQPLSACGHALQRNGERHLRRLDELQALYRAPWLAETERLTAGCRFQLDRLHYEYPHELVPTGLSPSDWLRQLTEAGLQRRWPPGVPAAVRQQIEHELALIGELRYEHYFLTVEDIVRHARKLGILCQGRGSAANSAVCYALGITEVDPARGTLLFERFISRERNEPPDIDVDFEHERREEVIQYIYGKYGRERAALAATVICYRAKSAIRDVGRALGLPLAQIDQITRSLAWWDGLSAIGERLAERGLDADAPVLRRLLRLVQDLVGFPRHLSQHVGGFVISHHPLHTLVPVENAAMPDRTIIQWDKDDLESLRLLKVDCLALGMLSAIRRCFEMVNRGRAVPVASS
ncbi:MAG: PHP domain-containing protein, partial [Xanthomonadales bacterium]|nr:PHP domain-containing protein [Xanthomonadales bacterium]